MREEEEYPLPPPLQVVESGRLPFWKGLLLVLLGGVLGAAVSLGVLFAVNRTLQFTPFSFASQLEAEVVSLSGQNETLQQEFELVRGEVDDVRQQITILPQMEYDLEQVSAQADTLETNLADLQKSLGKVQTQLTEMDTQLEGVQKELKAVSEKAKRFDDFLAGLLELLQETAPAG